MGDVVEDIIAEPEEPSFIANLFSSLLLIPGIVQANGWYLLIAGALAYYVWSKRAPSSSSPSYPSRANLSPKELQDFQSKEEARRRYVEQLQEKYNQESAEQAEKDRIKEEEKRKARAAELEALAKSRGIQKLGKGADTSKKNQSLRPEYNPLMGDTSSSRACFRPSGGRQGG